jgi:hypothetical protein
MVRRLGGGKSRRFAVLQILAGEDTPNARRAFTDPRASLASIAASSLQRNWVRPRRNSDQSSSKMKSREPVASTVARRGDSLMLAYFTGKTST